MEISHRGTDFVELASEIESNLRALLGINSDYGVLFMHGGATGQFAAVPLNLLGGASCANYVESGHWARRAITEAKRYCAPRVVASLSQASDGVCLPSVDEWRIDEEGAYLHYTPNETIDGVEFHDIPEVDQVLVADCSSNILSRPMDVSRHGLIYAGAQKNVGPAGLGIVIVRKDLLGRPAAATPAILDYAHALEHDSMYNTPPVFAWYMSGLVFKWLLDEGGLEAVGQRNERKAKKLYAEIDGNPFYSNSVAPGCRSRMNIPFLLARPELEQQFLAESQDAGLLGLKGHRSVGGMRASIYNAVSEESVDALVSFMQDFAGRRG